MYSRDIKFTPEQLDQVPRDGLGRFNITIVDHDGALLMYTIKNAAEEAASQQFSDIIAYMRQEYNNKVELTVIYNNQLRLVEVI